MTQYAVADSFYARYPSRRTSITSLEAQALLQESSLRLDMMLGKGFTAPFSSNNLTAFWLTVLGAEYILRTRMEDPNKVKALQTEVNSWIGALNGRQMPMVLDPSGQLWAVPTTQPGQVDQVTATDGGFLPAFTMDNPKYYGVDINRINDERMRRDQPQDLVTDWPWRDS